MTKPLPCRLHVILARAAPVAMVLRRGPARWSQVLRWDLDKLALEPGGWLHGKLYPRRCSLSPDGKLLRYCALTGQPPPWQTYAAISKLPWLTALCAWNTFGTYMAPWSFAPSGSDLPPPFHGTVPSWLRMSAPPPLFYYTGREDGWSEAGDGARYVAAAPPRRVDYPIRLAEDGTGPQVLRSPAPRRGHALVLLLRGVTFSPPPHEPRTVEGLVADYFLESGESLQRLDVTSANWDAHGRLLLADRRDWLSVCDVSDGKSSAGTSLRDFRVREASAASRLHAPKRRARAEQQLVPRWSADVNAHAPRDRRPSPEEARRW